MKNSFSPLRIGILGASRGMDFAMRLLTKKYPYAKLVSVCESYQPLCEKTEATLREMGLDVKGYTDYDTFLNESRPDAVIIANYANKHVPYALKALRKGIHVMSEVMPVQTLAEAVELCDAVEESGCVYAYCENYCYFDTCYQMRVHCLSGDIGEPLALEGTFINDCSPKWDILTRGIRDHWRNYVPSTFYCSHSIGPMLFSTGLRPVRVNGTEMPRAAYLAEKGARSGSAAMELMELSNGGMARSMNGNLRHPYEASYRLIGTEGSIECTPDTLRIYRYTTGFSYDIKDIQARPRKFSFRPEGDLGSIPNADFAAFGYFVGKIFGNEDCAKNSIDVYSALDMALPGLLAYRSILQDGASFRVPDFRNKEIREEYRNDHYSTSPEAAPEFRLPTNKSGTPEVSDEIYEKVQKSFGNIDLTPGGK